MVHMVLRYGSLLQAAGMPARQQSRSVSRILSAPRLTAKEATISLGRGLLLGSSGLPESNFPRRREARRAASSLIFGLAPGGVCRAPGITPGAVSSYLAFSPLPFSRPAQCTRSGRYVFCDTFRSRPLARRGPLLFTGHPALWSSDFPHPARGGTRLPDLLWFMCYV